MRFIIALALSILVLSPAEAGIIRAMKRAACKTIAVVSYPITAPTAYVIETTAIAVYSSRGNWRMAGYIAESMSKSAKTQSAIEETKPAPSIEK